jgi:hypothetical protein
VTSLHCGGMRNLGSKTGGGRTSERRNRLPARSLPGAAVGPRLSSRQRSPTVPSGQSNLQLDRRIGRSGRRRVVYGMQEVVSESPQPLRVLQRCWGCEQVLCDLKAGPRAGSTTSLPGAGVTQLRRRAEAVRTMRLGAEVEPEPPTEDLRWRRRLPDNGSQVEPQRSGVGSRAGPQVVWRAQFSE